MYLFLFAFEGHVVFPPKDHESEPYRFPMTLQAPELNTQHVAVYSGGHNDRQDKHIDFFLMMNVLLFCYLAYYGS